MEPALLDTDTLSDIMKARDPHVRDNARQYLSTFGYFTFSLITRYEILRGLKARRATRQIARFEQRCQHSAVLPVTDAIIVRAADLRNRVSEGVPCVTTVPADVEAVPAGNAVEDVRVKGV